MALYSADSLTESEDSLDLIYFLATLCRDSPCLIKMTSIVKSFIRTNKNKLYTYWVFLQYL